MREYAIVLALLLVCLALAFPYFEQVRNANEVPRLLQAVAVVEAGEWSIDGDILGGMPVGPDVSRSPVDERVYPNKPPGTTLVGIVAWSFVRLLPEPTLRGLTFAARLLGGILPTLVLVGFALRRYAPRFGVGAATVAVVLYTLGSPAQSYAHLFYGHQLAACLLFVGSALLLDGVRDRVTRRVALGAGVAASAVVVEYGTAFAGVPIAVMLLHDAWGRRDPSLVAAGIATALVPILCLGAYHHFVFGSPISTGYHHAIDPEFARKHGQGLLGLRVPTLQGVHTHVTNPKSGLLFWAPVFVFGVFGLVAEARESGDRGTEGRLFLAMFMLVLLLGTGLSFDGGWRVGPRYMVAVFPFMIPGIARAFGVLGTRAGWLAAFGFAAGWGVVVNSLAANLWPHIDLVNIHEPVGEVLVPLLRAGRQPYSLPWLLGLRNGAWLCIATCALVPAALLVSAASDSRARGIVAASFVVGAVAISALVPSVAPRHPRSARNFAYIAEKAWEPTGFSAGPTHSLPPQPLTGSLESPSRRGR